MIGIHASRELERRLGVQLIERMGKRAHAAAPCRELMVAAQGIFRECDLAYAAMRRFREALKAAVASNVGMAVIPEVAAAKQAPEITVRPLQPPLSRTLTLI